jgi:tripartite-type tricarboxylate transporter receptor subunit TctC
MTSRRSFVRASAAALGAAAFSPLRAQTFPNKSMTILVPFPAGGPADQMARVIGEILADKLGQAVLVDNRPGGAGQIAGGALIRQPADGHTLLLAELSVLSVNALLYKKFAYDPLAEFQPVAGLRSMPMMVLVPRSSPANTLADLIALARTRPVNYASPGVGTVAHLAGEQIRTEAKVTMTHIPYKGSGPAMADLLGGQVDALVDGLGPALPQVREGKIKALAIATPKRSAMLPNVPTTAEAGYPGVLMSALFGIATRTGTPAPVVQKLYDEIALAYRQPKFAKRFDDLGFEQELMTPEQFRTYIKTETERQGAVIKANNISAE